MRPGEWAATVATRAHALGDVPRYGDQAWQSLPPSDPRFAAAVAVAAECWRDHCSHERVAADLMAAMVEQEDELRRRVREASWDVCTARDWAAYASTPTHAQLVERRAS